MREGGGMGGRGGGMGWGVSQGSLQDRVVERKSLPRGLCDGPIVEVCVQLFPNVVFWVRGQITRNVREGRGKEGTDRLPSNGPVYLG